MLEFFALIVYVSFKYIKKITEVFNLEHLVNISKIIFFLLILFFCTHFGINFNGL
jgi:hypothetical protein